MNTEQTSKNIFTYIAEFIYCEVNYIAPSLYLILSEAYSELFGCQWQFETQASWKRLVLISYGEGTVAACEVFADSLFFLAFWFEATGICSFHAIFWQGRYTINKYYCNLQFTGNLEIASFKFNTKKVNK